MAEVVVGQDVVVERILIALFTGGHLMLQGVPGLAKTLLVNAVAKAVDLQFARIQFTIDMLPSDIIGSEILDQRTGEFRVRKGPVFTNLLLADEINRAAPKAQSAMLEAMQERKVTIGNESFRLPVPFLVIATQNPIEQSGTFELPEAQLDRFLLYHRLDYPTAEQEEEILRRQLAMGLKKDEGGGAVPKTAFDMIAAEPCATIADLARAMEAVQQVHVSEVFLKHSVELVRRTRRVEAAGFRVQPAGQHRPGHRLAGAGLHPRPRLRGAGGPVRAGRGRDPAPHPPDLRGGRRRAHRPRNAGIDSGRSG